ncbi:hypothetical protein D9M71_476520 [compost metagenome]
MQHPLQACVDTFDKTLPGLQAIALVLTAVPTLDKQREQALELAAILSTVAQDMLGFGLFWQQAGQQTADHGVGIELVESGIGCQLRHVAAGVMHGCQRQARGILLAA